MRRYGWTNKNRPNKKGGFYEIVCPVCNSTNAFVLEKKDLPYHNHPTVMEMLKSPYYVARKISKQRLGDST